MATLAGEDLSKVRSSAGDLEGSILCGRHLESLSEHRFGLFRVALQHAQRDESRCLAQGIGRGSGGLQRLTNHPESTVHLGSVQHEQSRDLRFGASPLGCGRLRRNQLDSPFSRVESLLHPPERPQMARFLCQHHTDPPTVPVRFELCSVRPEIVNPFERTLRDADGQAGRHDCVVALGACGPVGRVHVVPQFENRLCVRDDRRLSSHRLCITHRPEGSVEGARVVTTLDPVMDEPFRWCAGSGERLPGGSMET